MKKKGVEMSMNVIIIAAIGLLILLIFQNFGRSTSCDTKGETYKCVQGAACNEGDYKVPAGWSCEKGSICCSKSLFTPNN